MIQTAVEMPPHTRLRWVPASAGTFAMCVGTLALLGWTFDIHALKSAGGPITMKANTALALVMCGLSLRLRASRAARHRRLATVLAAFTGLLAFLTLSQHVIGGDLGIDQRLFTEAPGALGATSPGRMGLNTSLGLTLSAVALLSLNRRPVMAQALAFIVWILATLALLGYWYGAEQLYSVAKFSGIAWPTALTLLVISLGLLSARTDAGPVAALVAEGVGGVLARRLLGPAILATLAIGYIRLLGQRANLYDTGLGLALFAMTLVVVFVILIWRTAVELNESHRGRVRAERALLDLNTTLAQRIAEGTAALAANDALLRQFVKHSPAAIAMFDRQLRYLQMSDRWLIDYNLSGRDLLGQSHYEVFPEISAEWKAVHQRVLGGAVETCDEDPVPRADGSTDWLQWECRPWFDAAGGIGGIVMHTQVITGRKVIEERVKASLREKDVLLKEIHHRVKNNLQIISTLLDLQSAHTTDAAALEMFQESRGRVKSMAMIHERLYRSQDLAGVNFVEYIRQLAADLYRTYKISDDDIRLELDVDVPPLTIDIAIPCALLLNELISNSFKHAFVGVTEGRLRISLKREGASNVLTVSDDGAGFPAGMDFRNTTSFGLQLVNTLVDQLNGEVALTTGPGTTFTIRFRPPTSTLDRTPA